MILLYTSIYYENIDFKVYVRMFFCPKVKIEAKLRLYCVHIITTLAIHINILAQLPSLHVVLEPIF